MGEFDLNAVNNEYDKQPTKVRIRTNATVNFNNSFKKKKDDDAIHLQRSNSKNSNAEK